MELVADPWSDPKVAERILRSYRSWAVVGCSSNPRRASNGVSRYLLSQGYRVVPVNPHEQTVHGLPAFPDLRSVPADHDVPIEVVDIFRRGVTGYLVKPLNKDEFCTLARKVGLEYVPAPKQEKVQPPSNRGSAP